MRNTTSLIDMTFRKRYNPEVILLRILDVRQPGVDDHDNPGHVDPGHVYTGQRYAEVDEAPALAVVGGGVGKSTTSLRDFQHSSTPPL